MWIQLSVEICKLETREALKFENNGESRDRSHAAFLFAFLVPVLPGGKTKISGAHLRGNVRFYGSRLTPYVSRHGSEHSLAKPSGGAKLEISRVSTAFFFLTTTFRTKCLGIALMAFRSSFESRARSALHRARTYV